MTKPDHTETIEKMKKWCLNNYTNGADTMVECWEDDAYLDLIEDEGVEGAWELLKSIAEVHLDRQNEAKNS